MLIRIAICAVALALLTAAPAVRAQDSDTAPADTVTLRMERPGVGGSITFKDDFGASVTFDMLLNNNPAGQLEVQNLSSDNVVATIDAVADGKVTKATLKVLAHRRSTTQNQMPMESPTWPGKSYTATLADDKITIVDSEGTAIEGEELEFVFPMADRVINGEPVVNALPTRELKVGESFDIPTAAANRHIPKSQKMSVESMKATLTGLKVVDGRQLAEFKVEVKSVVKPQEGLTLTIRDTGTVRVDVATGLLVHQSTTGVMTVSGSMELQPGQVITYDGEGSTNGTSTVDIAEKKDE